MVKWISEQRFDEAYLLLNFHPSPLPSSFQTYQEIVHELRLLLLLLLLLLLTRGGWCPRLPSLLPSLHRQVNVHPKRCPTT